MKPHQFTPPEYNMRNEDIARQRAMLRRLNRRKRTLPRWLTVVLTGLSAIALGCVGTAVFLSSL